MSRARRVLLIEDDAEIRGFVRLALQDEGYEVIEAEHGAAALALLARPDQSQPALILLDLRMPVMDGLAFAEAYRRLPGPHAPIVAITATRDSAGSAAAVQAAAILAKPFSLDELFAVVEHFVPHQ